MRSGRKTRRHNRRSDPGPVLSLSVADWYRAMLTGQSPATPTYEEYLRVNDVRST
jgi:hypothetical protein